jgi:hypothetical protein
MFELLRYCETNTVIAPICVANTDDEHSLEIFTKFPDQAPNFKIR